MAVVHVVRWTLSGIRIHPMLITCVWFCAFVFHCRRSLPASQPQEPRNDLFSWHADTLFGCLLDKDWRWELWMVVTPSLVTKFESEGWLQCIGLHEGEPSFALLGKSRVPSFLFFVCSLELPWVSIVYLLHVHFCSECSCQYFFCAWV